MFKNPWDNNLNDCDKDGEKKKHNTSDSPHSYTSFFNLAVNHEYKILYLSIVISLLLWLSTGFFIVDTNEVGIVMRFGNYSREIKPGLSYKLPSPIETVEKVSVTRIKKDIIGRESSSDKENYMLTGDENIIDMHFYVQWRVSDAKKYLLNIKDDKNDNIVRNVAESVMRQVISENTLSEALSEKRLVIENEVKNNLQKIMNSYQSGIEIVSVGILYSYVGPEIRDAYRDVQSAKADREKFINQAQAYKNEVIPKAKAEAAKIIEEALAYKQSTISKAEGDAQRFVEVLKSYSIDKDITKSRMYLDTMEKVYKNINKVLVDKELSKNGVLPFLTLDKPNK